MSTPGPGGVVTPTSAGGCASEGEVARRNVQLYGHRIRYLEAGRRGRGPLVVLMHGLAGDATTWTGVLPSTLATLSPRWVHHLARQTALRAGVAPDDLDGLGRAMLALSDSAARAAFLHTVRSSVTWSGQRLSATGRLAVLAGLPSLLIAGRRDGVIPYTHALAAHQRLPHSRLRILNTGHFPHLEQPELVAGLISDLLVRDAGVTAPRRRRRAQRLVHRGGTPAPIPALGPPVHS